MKKYILTLLLFVGSITSFADEVKKTENKEVPKMVHGTYYLRCSKNEHMDVFLKNFAKLSHVSIKADITTSGDLDDIFLEIDGEQYWAGYYIDSMQTYCNTHAQFCVGWIK